MSHLNGSGAKNPQITLDTAIQNIQQQPKRVRYEMIPNQIFDPKFKDNPQRNYEQIVELQAYQWMRIETLKEHSINYYCAGNFRFVYRWWYCCQDSLKFT